IYDNTWSDFEQEEEWNIEEPSGSTGIKEASETSSIPFGGVDAVVIVIFDDVAVDLWPLVLVPMEILVAAMGNYLENTIQDLVDSKVRIEDFPLITICLMEDVFYSSDNRRLYCFKKAIKRGLDVDRIPVRIRRVSDINIGWKMEGAYRVVWNTNFKEVVVSPLSRNGRVADGEGYWEEQVDNYLENYINNWHERNRNETEMCPHYEEMIRINNNHNKQREKREAKERDEREKQRQYDRKKDKKNMRKGKKGKQTNEKRDKKIVKKDKKEEDSFKIDINWEKNEFFEIDIDQEEEDDDCFQHFN
ncbi:5860_t:CDS:2, partial [Dentiscutata erythropus]